MGKFVTTGSASSPTEESTEQFPPAGLTYFWALNGPGDRTELRRQITEFARAGITALILHPRSGLLVPYGGTDWFDFIRTLVDDCIELGVEPWLYDEDPYPSGSSGGRIAADHPELRAHAIERIEAPATLREGELFLFPFGRLLWCGAASANDDAIDFTERVGVIRRNWEVAPWDSRWYYAATPLYPCPRSEARWPEFALRRPALPAGAKLVAFIARPISGGHWELADSLNPAATKQFIERTHDRYAATLGDRIGAAKGKTRAIFTDEAKPHASHPWTPAMFESFQQQFGYDLRPRLEDLFAAGDSERAMLTRLHYRRWVAERFIEAWLVPVSQWCRKHDLALIGHFSPEDDPILQAATIGNFFPMQKYLTLAGIDVIVPAVGDARHPILNVGVACATSAAQQFEQPTVMSETLGASNNDLTGATAAKILAWQTLSGVGMIVAHAAFETTLGLRRFDAPPDCGPNSPLWRPMAEIHRAIAPFQEIVKHSTQVAPVAILWPIRSFQAYTTNWWLKDDTGPRRDFMQLLLACLQAHVGVHVLDEEQLATAELRGGKLCVGRARYETILLPSATVLADATVRRLRLLRDEDGINVRVFGDEPAWVETNRSLERINPGAFDRVTSDDWTAWCREHLPRLLPIASPRDRDVRVTAWRREDQTTWLMMNLADEAQSVRIGDDQTIALAAAQIVSLRADGKANSRGAFIRNDARAAERSTPAGAAARGLGARWPEEPWRSLDRPLAAYQLRPRCEASANVLAMDITGAAFADGTPVAAHLDYAAKIRLESSSSRDFELIFEPTAQRGRFTVTLHGRDWSFMLRDIDVEPVRIPLGEVLRAGDNDLRIRVHEPMSLDGIKWPPTVRANG